MPIVRVRVVVVRRQWATIEVDVNDPETSEEDVAEQAYEIAIDDGVWDDWETLTSESTMLDPMPDFEEEDDYDPDYDREPWDDEDEVFTCTPTRNPIPTREDDFECA